MNSNDDFDKFLIDKFQDSNTLIEDDGFTEKVLAGLPAKAKFSVNRNYILGSIGILSIIIFFVSNGFKSLLNAMYSLFSNISHLTKPSFTSVFIILVFVCISFIIARIEFDESPV